MVNKCVKQITQAFYSGILGWRNPSTNPLALSQDLKSTKIRYNWVHLIIYLIHLFPFYTRSQPSVPPEWFPGFLSQVLLFSIIPPEFFPQLSQLGTSSTQKPGVIPWLPKSSTSYTPRRSWCLVWRVCCQMSVLITYAAMYTLTNKLHLTLWTV